MQCPKCNGSMSQISGVDFILANKCENCAGLWFPQSGHEEAKKIKNAAAIDTVDTNASKAYNPLNKINCPECSQKMIRMVDKDQFHIEYESCPSCYGAFFDAGEFADLTEHTALEKVKQLFDTLKSNIKN